ncbi:MAG: hypothetical protein WBF13_01430 [Candidatus Zixiibacteriota bacterium]
MRTKSIHELVPDLPKEERRLTDFREIPCKDMDSDCFALDGRAPFGSYRRCYEYAPELGRCIFYEWERSELP